MIPKIIHQIWVGDQSKKPENLMRTWRDNHPNWEYVLWTEKEIEDFGLINKARYSIHPMLSGKADIARYEILFRFGGFFIDADSISIKPLDDLLDNSFISVYESEKYRKNLVANGYIGVEKSSKAMFDMIVRIRNTSEDLIVRRHAWETTGPLPFTKVLSKQQVEIMESKYFIPLHFQDEEFSSFDISKISKEEISKLKNKYPNSYSYQFWGSKSNY